MNKSTSASQEKRSLFYRLAYGSAVAGVWGVILGVILIAVLSLDMPDLENLPAPGINDTAVVVKAANGATLVRTGPIYGDWISFRATPQSLINAFTAVEDRHFFEHGGIDVRGLARAVLSNIRAGGVRAGGSTITQQLAKNLFLSNERTIKRKAQELLLALWIEQKFTKEQILTLYLNRVYFGGGTYGIDAASRKFFGHAATNLSIAESALIAGLVKAPSRLAPHINPEGAWKRAKVVLGAMVDAELLSSEAEQKIRTEPPAIKTAIAGRNVRYYTDWAESEARRLVPNAHGKSFVIYTTLDPSLQRAAALAVERGLSGEGQRQNANQGALVAIDLDGAVRAMVGGRNYGQSQYNRVTQAERQPGSAFKLFTYLAALESGIKPADRFNDRPTVVGDWAPQNYTKKFNGEMSAQEAFARSINTVAVQISENIGREKSAEVARRLGISTNVSPVPSLPLGTEEVKLIDLAGSYATVANGGHLAKPYSIVEISTLEGEVLYRRRPQIPRAVVTYPVIKDMTDMMASVVLWGSGRNAAIDRPAAGKSGTSQDSRDAVFAGFTSDITAIVWVGNDNGDPMKNVTGGGLPARIWHDFMVEASAAQPVRPLLADAGIYSAAASQATYDEQPVEQIQTAQKKKKRSFLSRLFGGSGS
ncbi:transglycosylase domain-containing protein [Kordiimonas aquimaris]|uniref:transglycosylase domain-containing protein n=1 Tax=Kordiimonas aquimaris TaxID=707591 RepID=UPI0021D1AAC6|nr:PBP1A family penicillin-binding protein [Kordiimonas aquimaris]